MFCSGKPHIIFKNLEMEKMGICSFPTGIGVLHITDRKKAILYLIKLSIILNIKPAKRKGLPVISSMFKQASQQCFKAEVYSENGQKSLSRSFL